MTDQPGWSNPQGQPTTNQPGQQPYGQAAYGQPQAGYGQPMYVYPASRGTNSLAIVALVLALTIAPGGIICGIIARRQIRETGEDGDGMALAGLIIGWVVTGLFGLYIVGNIVLLAIAFGMSGVS